MSEVPPVSSTQMSLLPAELMALTVGLAQVREGRPLLPNIAATCVLALARLTGAYDYTKEPA